MQLPFRKYHGLGNDFILFDAKAIPQISGDEYPQLAKAVCDRHTGIGADGMIVLETDPLEMVYYNQDGSRAPMCGNGIRCFTKFYQDLKSEEGSGLHKGEFLTVSTLAGDQIVEILNTNPFKVRVCMGKADFDPAKIGADHVIDEETVSTQYGDFTLTSFFLGTVHTVVFVQDDFADYENAGRVLCHHPYFSNQSNINFVKVKDRNHLEVTTYERGCGLTLACGTGISASAFCANDKKICDDKISVQAAIGSLDIEIGQDGLVYMSGPAKRVCKGEYDYD